MKKKVTVYDGKYGLYIKAGTKNIALPDDIKADPKKVEALTEEQVIEIVKAASKKK